MLTTIPAAEAKNKFGLLMDTVQREAVAISKKGRTSAIMMSVHEYEEYEQLKLEKLQRHVAKGLEQADRGETIAVLFTTRVSLTRFSRPSSEKIDARVSSKCS